MTEGAVIFATPYQLALIRGSLLFRGLSLLRKDGLVIHHPVFGVDPRIAWDRNGIKQYALRSTPYVSRITYYVVRITLYTMRWSSSGS